MADETSTIPKGWKITTLGEVLDIRNGKSRPQDGNKYPVYGGNGVLGYADEYNINEEIIIVGRVGAYCGCIYFEKNKFWLSDNALGVLANENSNIKFLYYLLKRLNLNKQAIGGAQPLLTQGVINQIEVLTPEKVEEQRAIAAVLSSLDDKIELLREQNKTLEATAQAIFKEWFVNYHFPGVGKMVDSEIGKIPEWWRVGKLGDEIQTILGGTPSTEKKEYWENGNIPWINSGKVNDFRIYEPTSYITEKALDESAAKLMPKGTVVIAITGATLGQVSMLEIESTGNQSVIGIIPNEKFSSAYLFYWMLKNVSTIINTATGGAQQHINKNDVNGFDFIVPADDILKKHYEAVNPMIEKISSNCFQIQTLSTLRDTLLPKLMKGELRIKN
ncbi:restriction endonuclease subunit S [Patescibacteria group bacterium]|nr:restriction endonuclease subunit S [Patescibacteria group bacterium]